MYELGTIQYILLHDIFHSNEIQSEPHYKRNKEKEQAFLKILLNQSLLALLPKKQECCSFSGLTRFRENLQISENNESNRLEIV